MKIVRTSVAIALAALLAAGVAIGARALTMAGGNIQACVGQNTGLVRIVGDPSVCRNSETALSWPGSAQAGPTAYAHHGSTFVHLFNPSNPGPGPYTLVGSLSLPAGKYIANAKLILANQTGFHTAVRCVLRAPATTTLDEAATYVAPADGTMVHVQTLPLQSAVNLPVAAALELRCLAQSSFGAPDVVASDVKLGALTVDSLVMQP